VDGGGRDAADGGAAGSGEAAMDAAARAAELRNALRLPAEMPLLRAALEPHPESAAALRGAHVVAFSAIAHPRRFFGSLSALGCTFARAPLALPDHAPITDATLDELRRHAARCGARLATTSKDFVRLRAEQRAGVAVLAVRLRWLAGAERVLDDLVRELLTRTRAA
jgi:tetraacyldisaccharide-1-P 4'-kinase